jgi:hypothetical protein
VFCHRYQATIVSPIDGGTNHDGCLNCTATELRRREIIHFP